MPLAKVPLACHRRLSSDLRWAMGRLVGSSLANFEASGDLAYCEARANHTVGPIQLIISDDELTSTSASAGSSGGVTCSGSFGNQAALELAQCPKMRKISRPPDVVMSMASASDRNPEPQLANAVTVSIKWGSKRPSRSSFCTTSISNPACSRALPGAQRDPSARLMHDL